MPAMESANRHESASEFRFAIRSLLYIYAYFMLDNSRFISSIGLVLELYLGCSDSHQNRKYSTFSKHSMGVCVCVS